MEKMTSTVEHQEKNGKKRERDDNVTFPPPLGPTSATFEPGFNFNVIPCN